MRSLAGIPGLRCLAVSERRDAMAWGSRYAAGYYECPDPDVRESDFIRFLWERASEWDGSLLLPSGDLWVRALSRHRDELAKAYHVAVAPWEAVRPFLEKDRLQQLAQEAGVPMPAAILVQPGQVRCPPVNFLRYPIWIKPAESARFVRRYGRKGFLAPDRATLETLWARLRDAGQTLLFQEVVPGGDDRYEIVSMYVTRSGTASAITYQRKVRQHPPGFGVMRVGYAMQENPEAEQLARRLLHVVKDYRGLLYFEFKRDPRDNRLKLIEVNVRVARFGMLPTASGVNYPELFYRELVGGEMPGMVWVLPGTWWIEILPDLLYTFFHRSGRQYSWREKVRPYLQPRKVYGDFDWRDPLPFVRQIRRGILRMREGPLPCPQPIPA